MKVSELFAEIGFKVDTRGLKEFSKSLNSLNSSIKKTTKDIKSLLSGVDQLSKKRNIKISTEITRNIKTNDISYGTYFGNIINNVTKGIYHSIVNGFKKAAGGIKESILSSMMFRDYRTFTGRSASELSGLMGRALNTTNLTTKEVLQATQNFEKKFWDIWLGKASPEAFHMLGILPTGNGKTDITNALTKISEIQSGGLRASMLESFGLEPSKWMQVVEDIAKGKSYAEVYSLVESEIDAIENANRNLRTFAEVLEQAKAKFVSLLLADGGLGDVLEYLTNVLRSVVAVMRTPEFQGSSGWNKLRMLLDATNIAFVDKEGGLHINEDALRNPRETKAEVAAGGFAGGIKTMLMGMLSGGNPFLFSHNLYEQDISKRNSRFNNVDKITINVRSKDEAIDITNGINKGDYQVDMNYTTFSEESMVPIGG